MECSWEGGRGTDCHHIQTLDSPDTFSLLSLRSKFSPSPPSCRSWLSAKANSPTLSPLFPRLRNFWIFPKPGGHFDRPDFFFLIFLLKKQQHLVSLTWKESSDKKEDTGGGGSYLLRIVGVGDGSVGPVLSSCLLVSTKVHVGWSPAHHTMLELSARVRRPTTDLWTWTLGCLLSARRPPRMSMPLGLLSLQAGVPFPPSFPVLWRPRPLGDIGSWVATCCKYKLIKSTSGLCLCFLNWPVCS